MRRRTKLRTRMLASLVLTAAFVLALAGTTTYLLVQAAAEEAAISDLSDKAAELQRQASSFKDLLDARSNASVTTPGRLDRRRPATGDTSLSPAQKMTTYLASVVRLLRLADARVVFLDANGVVVDPVDLGRPVLTGAGRSDVFSLPPTIPPDSMQTKRVLAGETVTGSHGSMVFLAEPIASGAIRGSGGERAAIVLTQRVETNVVGRAGPAFLVAAAAALIICVAISLWLARRLTRPLHAVEVTARRLAAGDLAARVEVNAGTEDEPAMLAATLNTMAAQLEHARGAERSFLLSVSHDLRTPLTSIRGYAEALADGTIDAAGPEERIRAAGIISSEARRLERLVRDLLDLARLDTRQFSLHPGPCDAAAVVSEAADAFGPAASDLGVALHTDDIPATLPADIDADRLGQVVANLVENALKFATSAVQIAVTEERDGFSLSVEDDGPGIPADQVSKVFERLHTARGTPARSVGTGLGLAIVHELSNAMGGTARVERSDGHGTRFVVRLPIGPLP